MIVTFISQCEKKAMKRTRKILDAFANRIGDNVWQTNITEIGLKTVYELLKSTASKSTAVACHRIATRHRTELVWVVGNKSAFNHQGHVPVNRTEKDMSEYQDSFLWKTQPIITIACGLAGLFHDIGKANILFQNKLNPDLKTPLYEPYRHEWVSVRLFLSLVADARNDEIWLDKLINTQFDDFNHLFRDGLVDMGGAPIPSVLADDLPPLAQLVAWLILSHHKLPFSPKNREPKWENIKNWLKALEPNWNSQKCNGEQEKAKISNNWTFNQKLPIHNFHWLSEICELAKKAKQHARHYQNNILHDDVFSSHIARLVLMLADHYYSALSYADSQEKGKRQPNYQVYANTYYDENGQRQYKQQLDEHLIGVAKTAQAICDNLPKFGYQLLNLQNNDKLTEKVKNIPETQKFTWQNKALNTAEKIGESTQQHGFFGINLASTGCGKTIANAKIMNAIGEKTGRVRFSVALGLRSLTLQTGRAFGEELGLAEELAVAVGGISAKLLFENSQTEQEAEHQNSQIDNAQQLGSESIDSPINPETTLNYHGKTTEHALYEWTKGKKEIENLIQAPVLVCTIDHLMPATEGIRGGQQIAPMLRLLSSDLILDEPDDFGENDLPALTRLVYWAGMLGSRVLLSTATMPPMLAYACFEAYQAGFAQFAKANLADFDGRVQCAWFDELVEPADSQIEMIKDFKQKHDQFINKRIKKLQEKQNKHIGKIIEMQAGQDTYTVMANTLLDSMIELHQNHHVNHQGKCISIGLVRMANIDPMIATTKKLISHNAPNDTCIHYCVYHSRYPLAIRSYIEEKLDRILNRKNADKVFGQPEIVKALHEKPDIKHHIFVVIASPVAEVGRDHDYDWAIIEPSSMRSIVQTAGRVLRHRESYPTTPNIYLLNQNIKSLKGKSICYEKPGFESTDFPLNEHHLSAILNQKDYDCISSASKIILPDDFGNLVKQLQTSDLSLLEHKVLYNRLLHNSSKNNQASHWWREQIHWAGELQHRQRFRKSTKETLYYLWLKNEYANIDLYHCEPAQRADVQRYQSVRNLGVAFIVGNLNNIGENCGFWFDLSPVHVYQSLMNDLQAKTGKTYDWGDISRQFGEVKIVQHNNKAETLHYYENLGIYRIRE